jgi:ABC-type branched-subunit amino acid transport system ATPase component
MNHALQTTRLVKRFGGFVATSDVTLNVAAGARHALIGPNGAGKTTLINLLTGFLEPSEGAVILKGEDVTHLAQHQRVKRGLARTFQINRLFADMTVLESVTLAVCERRGIGSRWWNPVGSHVEAIDEAAALLQQLRLIDVAHQQTKSLAYGRQRLIEIALALAAKAHGAAARRTRRRRPDQRKPRTVRDHRAAAARGDHPADRTRHGPGVPLCRPHLGAGRRRAGRRGHA